MLSDYAIWYLFLAGTASGAFLWAAGIDARENVNADARCIALRARLGFYACAACLGLAALLLFLDLGNPYDIVYLFESPLRSIMSVGAWLVMLCLAVSVAVSGIAMLRASIPGLVFRVAEIIGAVLSVGVMGYTGVLLSSMVSVDFWRTPLLVVLFVASAVSCGGAIVELLALLTTGTSRGLRDLGRATSAARAVEFAVLAAFIASRWFAGGAAQQSCEALMAGNLAGLFWGGLVLFGFAVPLACDVANQLVRLPALRLAGAAATLAGGACLRYCVVLAAAYSVVVVNVT